MNLIDICNFHREPPIGDQCVLCVVLWLLLMYTCRIRQTLQCHVLDCNAHTTNVGVVWFYIFSSRRIGCIVLFSVPIVVTVWCFWCMRYRKLCKQFDFQSLNESKSLEHHRGHIESRFVCISVHQMCVWLSYFIRAIILHWNLFDSNDVKSKVSRFISARYYKSKRINEFQLIKTWQTFECLKYEYIGLMLLLLFWVHRVLVINKWRRWR